MINNTRSHFIASNNLKNFTLLIIFFITILLNLIFTINSLYVYIENLSFIESKILIDKFLNLYYKEFLLFVKYYLYKYFHYILFNNCSFEALKNIHY